MTGNMNRTGLDPASAAELRALVREVLAEVLPARRPPGVSGHPAPASGQAAAGLSAGGVPSGIPSGRPARPDSMITEDPPPDRRTNFRDHEAQPPGAAAGWEVRIGSDADLREFALRVLKLADNPKQRRELIAGRIGFRLAGQPRETGRPAVHRVDKGAVTERAVVAAAAAGARLVLGPRAVLTPLGRDKARALGVPVDKER